MNQPTNQPTPKVAAVGAAGIVVTALVSVLALTGVIVPDNVSQAAVDAVTAIVITVSAVQTVIQFFAGYLKKNQDV